MSYHTQSYSKNKFVSRVLFRLHLREDISAIYLCDLPVAAPIAGIRRAALNTATYLVFQHPRFTQPAHHCAGL